MHVYPLPQINLDICQRAVLKMVSKVVSCVEFNCSTHILKSQFASTYMLLMFS